MDSRDFARKMGDWYKSIDKVAFTATVSYNNWDNDDNEVEETFTVPFKYTVCSLCNGVGTHVNPSVDSNGLTSEDFAEDDDFRESYFSGAYDMPCNKCHGKGLTPEYDETRASPEIKKKMTSYLKYRKDVAEDMVNDAYTRRMENGGYGY
jgi:hypothetical protein